MAAPTNTVVLSAIADIMRERLLPKIVDQLNSKVPFLTLAKRKLAKEHQVGRNFQILIPVRTKHNQSVGNRAELGALPDHQRGSFDQMTVALTRTYGQVAFSGSSLSAGLDAAKLANTMNEEMKSLQRSFQVDLNRQMQLDGSGAMCKITTATGSGTSFVVDDSRYLEVGMVIDSYTAKTGGTQNINSVEITDVDYITDTVTVASSVSWSQNDYVFREDNRGIEGMGLLGIVDDGTVVSTFQGIDRTATSQFNANLINVGAALSESAVIEGCDTVNRISGEDVDFIGSDHESRRWWQKLLQTERRQVNTMKLRGGFEGLAFMAGNKEIPWFVDRYFYPSYIYLLRLEDLFLMETEPPHWMDLDGAILSRISGYDAYEAVLVYYWQFAAKRCNSLGRIYGYTEPT